MTFMPDRIGQTLVALEMTHRRSAASNDTATVGRRRDRTAAARIGHDGALDAALERLAPGLHRDRPDTPDLHVTAVRRLPPVAAQVRALSRGSRPASEGGARGARHRRSSTRIRPRPSTTRWPGATSWSMTPTASGKTLCYNAPGPALDPAGSLQPGAVSVSDQGARAGSARRAAGDVRNARAASAATRSASSPTTATRRRTRGARIRARAHLVLSNPDMVHSGILPHHPRWAKLFENLATSSSTSCTRIAACSAAICATCCGGCGASAGTTVRIRSSSVRRRPSPTRASWPSA